MECLRYYNNLDFFCLTSHLSLVSLQAQASGTQRALRLQTGEMILSLFFPLLFSLVPNPSVFLVLFLSLGGFWPSKGSCSTPANLSLLILLSPPSWAAQDHPSPADSQISQFSTELLSSGNISTSGAPQFLQPSPTAEQCPGHQTYILGGLDLLPGLDLAAPNPCTHQYK